MRLVFHSIWIALNTNDVKLNDRYNNSGIEFETTIDDISVNGVDMIEWDDDGPNTRYLIFKVMIGENVFVYIYC